jgi:DMSO/TMAO reductase YedYZ molybdopterin-dependent catalytic subunit
MTGASIGLMLTTALAGITYGGFRIAGLPFPPYELFDWTTQRLPGALLTFGIDTMVSVINAIGAGSTADVAKLAEQSMAIAGFLVAGGVAGGLFFAVLRRTETIAPRWIGLALGLLTAIILLAIGRSLGRPGASAWIATPWILTIFAVHGTTLGWSYERLSPVQRVMAPTFERIDRRRFLVRFAGATATITVAGALVGRLLQGRRPGTGTGDAGEPWSATNPLPNADAAIEPVRGTRPELTPVEDHYRIDITTSPPVIDGNAWRLRIGGLVDGERQLTLDELRAYEPSHHFVTLACISNRVGGDLISTTRWTGVAFERLLADIGLGADATHLVIRSADGFHECVALETIRSDPRCMLCYAWDGLPLPVEHGFPLRTWLPDRFGMKQPKWIESIEAVDEWQAGYWVERGWDREARMRTTSVIDNIATDMMMPAMDGTTTIAVGGIAFAGARGISRVEVRVDDGPWTPAELREPLSDTTWVLWRHAWPFEAGDHTFTVRCVERDGTVQTAEVAPPHPSGATGLHQVRSMM